MGDVRGPEYDGPCEECHEVHTPEVYDVAGQPLYHGERDECTGCICGAPYYLLCEDVVFGRGTIENMVLVPADNEHPPTGEASS